MLNFLREEDSWERKSFYTIGNCEEWEFSKAPNLHYFLRSSPTVASAVMPTSDKDLLILSPPSSSPARCAAPAWKSPPRWSFAWASRSRPPLGCVCPQRSPARCAIAPTHLWQPEVSGIPEYRKHTSVLHMCTEKAAHIYSLFYTINNSCDVWHLDISQMWTALPDLQILLQAAQQISIHLACLSHPQTLLLRLSQAVLQDAAVLVGAVQLPSQLLQLVDLLLQVAVSDLLHLCTQLLHFILRTCRSSEQFLKISYISSVSLGVKHILKCKVDQYFFETLSFSCTSSQMRKNVA